MEQNKKEETIQTIASLAANRYTATLSTKLNRINDEMSKSAEAVKVLGLLKVAAQLIDSHADEIKAEQAARINGLFDYISTNENIKNFRIIRNNDTMIIKLQFKELVINDPNTIRYLCELYPDDIPRNYDFQYEYRQNPDEAIKNYELYYNDGYFEVALQINPFNSWYVNFRNSLDEGFDENNFNELREKMSTLINHYNNTSEGNVVQDFINSSVASLITGETTFRFELDGYNVGPVEFKDFENYQELAEAPLTAIIDTACNLNNIILVNSSFFKNAFRRTSVRKKGVTENGNN